MTPIPFAFALDRFADNLYADYCRKALIYKALKRFLVPIIGVDRFADSLWLRDRAAAAGRAWIVLVDRDDLRRAQDVLNAARERQGEE